jgi:hypothetical protein
MTRLMVSGHVISFEWTPDDPADPEGSGCVHDIPADEGIAAFHAESFDDAMMRIRARHLARRYPQE